MLQQSSGWRLIAHEAKRSPLKIMRATSTFGTFDDGDGTADAQEALMLAKQTRWSVVMCRTKCCSVPTVFVDPDLERRYVTFYGTGRKVKKRGGCGGDRATLPRRSTTFATTGFIAFLAAELADCIPPHTCTRAVCVRFSSLSSAAPL